MSVLLFVIAWLLLFIMCLFYRRARARVYQVQAAEGAYNNTTDNTSSNSNSNRNRNSNRNSNSNNNNNNNNSNSNSYSNRT